MLASNDNPFYIQLRLIRATVLNVLSEVGVVTAGALAERVQQSLLMGKVASQLKSDADEIQNDTGTVHKNVNFGVDAEYIKSVIEDLKLAGFDIVQTVGGGLYKLDDKILVDFPAPKSEKSEGEILDGQGGEVETEIARLEREYPDVSRELIRQLYYYSLESAPNKWHYFQNEVEVYFRDIGFDTAPIGITRGRTGDVLAKYIDTPIKARKYGIIIDAKASAKGNYELPVGDRRAMKEYIDTHYDDLLRDGISKPCFLFFAHSFSLNAASHLTEIEEETQVKGSLLGVEEAIYLAQRIKRREVKIDQLYDIFQLGRKITKEDIYRLNASEIA